MTPRLAIIGSTGVGVDRLLAHAEPDVVSTPGGDVDVVVGTLDDTDVLFMTRSGRRAPWPPHLVNYRANIAALRARGVDSVIATSVVGSLRPDIPPGTLVVIDQFLDFTKHRPHTWFGDEAFAFVDFTEPYCPRLRKALIAACQSVGAHARAEGCYVGVDGPRYETAAEVRMYGSLGGDVIGMTNIPECIFAREAGLCYAALAFVSNYGAGLSPRAITREENYAATLAHARLVEDVLRTLPRFLESAACCAAFAADVQVPRHRRMP